jgi:hypothetical protein
VDISCLERRLRGDGCGPRIILGKSEGAGFALSMQCTSQPDSVHDVMAALPAPLTCYYYFVAFTFMQTVF